MLLIKGTYYENKGILFELTLTVSSQSIVKSF